MSRDLVFVVDHGDDDLEKVDFVEVKWKFLDVRDDV
jgi:hypothetical protein